MCFVLDDIELSRWDVHHHLTRSSVSENWTPGWCRPNPNFSTMLSGKMLVARTWII